MQATCKLYSKHISSEGLLIPTPDFLCFRSTTDGPTKGHNIIWTDVLLVREGRAAHELEVVTREDTYCFYQLEERAAWLTELERQWCDALNLRYTEGAFLGRKDLDALLSDFRRLDTDGDGCLSFVELSRPLKLLYPSQSELPSVIFRAFDSTGDGKLMLGQFLDGMRCLLVGSDKDRAMFLFRGMDADKDGKLSLAEFEGFIRALAEMSPTFQPPPEDPGLALLCTQLYPKLGQDEQGNVIMKGFITEMPKIDLLKIVRLESPISEDTEKGKPLTFGDPKWSLIVWILWGLKVCGNSRSQQQPGMTRTRSSLGPAFRAMWAPVVANVMHSSAISTLQNNVISPIQSAVLNPISNNILAPIQESVQQDLLSPFQEGVWTPLQANVITPMKREIVAARSLDLKDSKKTYTLPTPEGEPTVTFTEFYENAFSDIRKFYGFEEDDYQNSLGLETLASNIVLGKLKGPRKLSSSGRSGSFFFITNDGKIILKSLPRKEAQTLGAMLEDYRQYMLQHGDTLLTVYMGLYEICVGDLHVMFVSMLNVFPPSVDIRRQFDLKGSTAGRTVPVEERHNVSMALKDLDFQETQKAILVETELQKLLFTQIQQDAEFLQKQGLNDYSFLLGIGNGMAKEIIPTGRASRRFYSGVPSCINKNEVYFCGIIDILTAYEGVKIVEHAVKTLYQTNFSCIPPLDYGRRFVDFLETIILTKQVSKLYLASTNTWASFESLSTPAHTPIRSSVVDSLCSSQPLIKASSDSNIK